MSKEPPLNLIAFLQMVKRDNYLILDTETTGLENGEVCQIAIVESTGNVLLDTLVKPVKRIPASATAIHSITNAMVKDAPSWGDVHPRILELLTDRDIVVYNAKFDRKMFHKSAEAAGLPATDWKTFSTWWCAMEAFAVVFGKRSSYGGFQWHSLAKAAAHYHIPVTQAHTALADCNTTLAVVKAMAERA
jgi:DNA polymerase III subunit epsilon